VSFRHLACNGIIVIVTAIDKRHLQIPACVQAKEVCSGINYVTLFCLEFCHTVYTMQMAYIYEVLFVADLRCGENCYLRSLTNFIPSITVKDFANRIWNRERLYCQAHPVAGPTL